MAVADPVVTRLQDVPAYAEAYALFRRVGALPALPDPHLLLPLRRVAATTCACVAESLRAGSRHEEIRRVRDASLFLADLRAHAWEAHRLGALRADAFDDLMTRASRALRELARLERAFRHRARRELDEA